MQIGIYSFGENTPDPVDGTVVSAHDRLRHLVEEMELADHVGLEVFALGEHHRPDFVVSTPAVVLAAGAERTERIRLSSAVSVLSSDDPVRVFQDFATLDLLSDGRAEIMAGRGSFVESFPLFGYDLDDYDELFAEKLALLLQLREDAIVHWPGGRHRAPIDGRGVFPRPMQDPLPIWLAVGGNPGSATRAGSLGLPMALAIIGGMPERFAPFADLYRRSSREAGFTPVLSINSHGSIAYTREAAVATAWPYVEDVMNRIGRERGWPPITRAAYEESCELRGANFIGSPQDIVDKILFQYEIFGHDRFLLQCSLGGARHEEILRTIELLGTVVAPAVREAIAASSNR